MASQSTKDSMFILSLIGGLVILAVGGLCLRAHYDSKNPTYQERFLGDGRVSLVTSDRGYNTILVTTPTSVESYMDFSQTLKVGDRVKFNTVKTYYLNTKALRGTEITNVVVDAK